MNQVNCHNGYCHDDSRINIITVIIIMVIIIVVIIITNEVMFNSSKACDYDFLHPQYQRSLFPFHL